jgi:hypothetical protein
MHRGQNGAHDREDADFRRLPLPALAAFALLVQRNELSVREDMVLSNARYECALIFFGELRAARFLQDRAGSGLPTRPLRFPELRLREYGKPSRTPL